MSINAYHTTVLKRLLDAPAGDAQVKVASAISYFSCIEIAVEAYAEADPITRGEIAELLNHLYHALERDRDYPPRYHWPAVVEENYAHFHRRTIGEWIGAGFDAAFHFLYSIPVLGFVIILFFAMITVIVMVVLYLVTLPFPKIHGEITRRMDVWATVAENAQ
jgi:hypothetical protein